MRWRFACASIGRRLCHKLNCPPGRRKLRCIFKTRLAIHFAAEERVVFPAARKFQELLPLLDELLTDHAVLREFFTKAEARNMSAMELSAFGQRMSDHIRKEERQLFERLQQLLNQGELSRLGKNLDEALKDAAQACALSERATRLRSSK